MYKDKRLVSNIMLIQTQTVDILVDKVFLNYNDKNTFQDTKGNISGMSLLSVYGIYLEYLDPICQPHKLFSEILLKRE